MAGQAKKGYQMCLPVKDKRVEIWESDRRIRWNKPGPAE